MDYEDVLQQIGGCGLYQKLMVGFVYASSIMDGLQIGSMVFMVPDVNHRCAIPGLHNETFAVQSDIHAEDIKANVPQHTEDGTTKYSSCFLFGNETTEDGNLTEYKCHSWVYDRSTIQTSMVTDMDLVCDDKILANHSMTFFFLGYLFAMIICGILSDRFGRKKVIIISLLIQGSNGIVAAWISNIYIIYVLRFLNAIGGGGSLIVAYVFGVEITSIENRMGSVMASNCAFTIGLLLLNFLAYFIRTWRLLLTVISIPSLAVAVSYIWIIPESPRWLLNVKRKEEADDILRAIAKMNKKKYVKTEIINIESSEKSNQVKVWKMFTIPVLRKRTLILTINWISISLVYYGLTLNVGNLYGDLYLNYFFNTLVELPAYGVCFLLLDRIGRKKVYSSLMVLTGIACISTLFPMIYSPKDDHWITTTIAILGRLFATAAFGTIYLFTLELYPTCIRNGALGALSTFARVGGSFAPYTLTASSLASGNIGKVLPMLCMGILSLIAGVAAFFLPETNNEKMMDTFEDVYRLKNSKKRIDENGDSKYEGHPLQSYNTPIE